MDSIPTTPKAVKSKQDYITLAEVAITRWLNLDRDNPLGIEIITQSQVYATLAIAAPEASAPDDYLSVCRERDEMKRQRDELLSVISRHYRLFRELQSGWEMYAKPCDETCLPDCFNSRCKTALSEIESAIQKAEQTAEPDAAE